MVTFLFTNTRQILKHVGKNIGHVLDKTDAKQNEDMSEKARLRKISEENAKAEKLRLENLMSLVQEKIDVVKYQMIHSEKNCF